MFLVCSWFSWLAYTWYLVLFWFRSEGPAVSEEPGAEELGRPVSSNRETPERETGP